MCGHVAVREPSFDRAHLAHQDPERRRQGDAIFGLIDQGEQVLGPNVRPDVPGAKELLTEAQRRSATVSSLVERLEH